MKRALANGVMAALLLALLLLVPVCADGSMDVLMNERLTVPADSQAHAYVFSPTANNLYTFQSFGSGKASAKLFIAGEAEPIYEESGFRFDARLIADATYRLEVTSEDAPAEVEIMRASLGRSFEQPVELTDLSVGYDKAIARAYDTHWYRFTARVTGLYVIRSTSQINTVGYLLSESGGRIAVNDNMYSPYSLDFRIEQRLEAGKTYLIRVSGRGEETGPYHLTVAEPAQGQGPPGAILLSANQLTLEEGASARITYAIEPKGAISDAVFLSTDPSIATVTDTGEVVSRAAGQCAIILSAANNVEARLTLTVSPIPVTGLVIDEQALTLHAGDTEAVLYRVTPERASNKNVRLSSSNEEVLEITRDGRIAALKKGEATLTLTTEDGGFSADVSVSVERARSNYRVLLMGEQRYTDGRVRTGSINTTQGLADVFARQKYDSGAPKVTVKLDSTRDEAIVAIREAFAGALETDVSILYINCHGGLTGREPWLEFHDGSRLTAAHLERVLRRVKGTVVLMIDCCQSGSFISGTAERRFERRMSQVFNPASAPRFASSKVQLICSASSTQDSYRISADGTNTENAMATVFGRGLCEAGGWDLIADKPTRLRADLNQDQKVTLFEAYLYVRRSVTNRLSRANVRQDVQLHPMGSNLVLFQK